jgi:multiple antibiotic resistance protein
MSFSEFINHFIALLVIANPLSALPAILRLTKNQSAEEKRHTGRLATLAVGVILLIATWIGKPLLMLLGIGLPAFQIAGGIVVFLMALSMLNAEESPIKHSAEESKGKQTGSGAIVPLAIPMIAGPGAISTLIVNVSQYPGMLNQILLSVSAILVTLVIGVLLYFSAHLEKVLGQTGVNVINRLGGLILIAISVQILASGLIHLFPILSLSQIPS